MKKNTLVLFFSALLCTIAASASPSGLRSADSPVANDVPKNVTATQGNRNGVLIDWNRLDGVQSYSVRRRAGCCRGINDRMLIISKIRGKDLGNRFLPRFFLLIFCTLRKQNVLTKYPILLTRFFEHVDQTKKRLLQKRQKILPVFAIC